MGFDSCRSLDDLRDRADDERTSAALNVWKSDAGNVRQDMAHLEEALQLGARQIDLRDVGRYHPCANLRRPA